MSENLNNDYIDPKFEYPWFQNENSLDDNINRERDEIAKVRAVIENFVLEMATRRQKWKSEYDGLFQLFKDKPTTPSIVNPIRYKKYRRYKKLKRIFEDLPKRETFATRDVHRKTHGCLAGKFTIRQDLEADLSKGGRYGESKKLGA